MKKLAAFLVAFLLAAVPALAQYYPPSGGGGPYQGSTVAPSTSGNVMTSNGSAWTSAAAAGGGGSSPFAPAGFANVSTFNAKTDLVVAPAGDYVYVTGTLTANSDNAVAKVKIAGGSVTTLDLGTADTSYQLSISPDGAHLYFMSGANKWWDVTTTGSMAIAHTSTLATGPDGNAQSFDLSPDGTIFAYVSGADAKLYMINTSTYAVTSQTMSHTAGNLTAVCFYNGSNSNVYVAHAGSGVVDLYAIGGAYTSSVSTGAGGAPAFNAMRSGINGNFFIADTGDNQEVIAVASGSPTKFATGNNPNGLSLANASGMAVGEANDVCFFRANDTDTTNGSPLYAIANYSADLVSIPVGMTVDYNNDRLSAPVVSPDGTRVFGLGGSSYPTVWSVPVVVATPPAGTAGYVSTSNGTGDLISAAPYFTSADQTITTAGALTIAHGLPYTPGSVWFALVNQSTEAGYTAGQVVLIGGSQTVSVVAVQNDGFSAIVDGTNLTIRYGSDASTFTIPNATTGAATAITNSKWKCRFFAR